MVRFAAQLGALGVHVVAQLFHQRLAGGRGDGQIREAELQQTTTQFVVAQLVEVVHCVVVALATQSNGSA